MPRSTVKYGSKNADVSYVQDSLNKLGYNAGTVDGIFGANTQSAVMAFQQAQGLVADGIVGAMTYSSLESALNNNEVDVSAQMSSSSSSTLVPYKSSLSNALAKPKSSSAIMSKIKDYYKNPTVKYGVPTVLLLSAFAYYMSSRGVSKS